MLESQKETNLGVCKKIQKLLPKNQFMFQILQERSCKVFFILVDKFERTIVNVFEHFKSKLSIVQIPKVSKTSKNAKNAVTLLESPQRTNLDVFNTIQIFLTIQNYYYPL